MVQTSLAIPVEDSLRTGRCRHLHVAVYSRVSGLGHPYFRLLHKALARRGVAISDSVEIGVSWLRANRGRIDAVHFHWPETIWRDRRSGARHFVSRAVHSSKELLRIARFLREAGRLGITRVWTIHNLEPHEGGSLWDRLGYRLFARSADIVLSHSVWSREEAKRDYGVDGSRSIVMPHGNDARGVSAGAAARRRAERARARSGAADDFAALVVSASTRGSTSHVPPSSA